MPVKNESDVATDTERVDYYELWELDPKEDYLIFATEDFVVWLDKDGDLDWQTDEEYDDVLDEKGFSARISEFKNRAAILKSYPIEHFTPDQRKNFRIMVGEGLARALEMQPESAAQMLDKAAEYGAARNQEIAHGWYVSGAFATAALFFGALLFTLLGKESGILMLGETKYYLGTGSFVGALGALLSVLLRAGKVPLDPSAGPNLHYLEGGMRIVVGVLSAAIIQTTAHIGIAFTIIAQKGHAGMFVLAFAAGFSEQLAKTIIKRVEMTSTPAGKAKN